MHKRRANFALAILACTLSSEFGGPAIGAWPTAPGEKLRPHMGGGGGNENSAQKMEDDRQARIGAAVSTINSIFNSKPGQTVTMGSGTRASSYDPKQTYYDSNGQVWKTPMTQSAGRIDPDTMQVMDVQDVPDQAAIDKAISQGLYTGTDTITPGGDREKMYQDQRDAVLALNKQEVDRQYGEAARGNKFALARAGLSGGSADIDSNAELQRRTNEGTMKAAGIADDAAAGLRVQDERTRGNLISMAQSGIDTGTAAQMALKGLEANSAQAAGARQGATIGDLFGNLGAAYMANQTNAGTRAGLGQQAQQWYGVSSPQQKYSGS